MKIAIIGAAGIRTPLIVQALVHRQARLGLSDLSLMDIDGERLELIGAVIDAAATRANGGKPLPFRLSRTTDPHQALQQADYVVTTFRVGGIESRLVDERIPVSHGLLGQETTGPGGFAMGLRSIGVILDYVRLMGECCPNAWLINFANPAGMLAQAVWSVSSWRRVVGICDAPASMARMAAALLDAPIHEIFLEYFGLNHLGWVRSVWHGGRDHLPAILQLIRRVGRLPGLPFDPQFLTTLGLIPNEYLFYYYSNAQAVQNILASNGTRAERIAASTSRLFDDLRRCRETNAPDALLATYHAYLDERGRNYMKSETGFDIHDLGRLEPQLAHRVALAVGGEGYAGVALDLIEGLSGRWPHVMYLNLPNQGAVAGMGHDDVVEVPAFVNRELIRPLALDAPPSHCLGLMQQVKDYERMTLSAAVQGSYPLALQALGMHPLVRDHAKAKTILDEYIQGHGAYFPELR